jgi:hypothetical protein
MEGYFFDMDGKKIRVQKLQPSAPVLQPKLVDKGRLLKPAVRSEKGQVLCIYEMHSPSLVAVK